jgi:co-chaperonin GroES (HSP10)
MSKGVILNKDGGTYKPKTDIIAVGGGKLSSEEKEEVKLVNSDAPLMSSEDMDITPVGNRIIARGFKAPEKTMGGIIIPVEAQKGYMAVFQVMKVGANVREVKEGHWVRVKEDFDPGIVMWEDEVFYLFQEYDVEFTYETPPKMNHIMESVTKITRDLTQYVEFDKLKDLRANITERMEGEVPDGE